MAQQTQPVQNIPQVGEAGKQAPGQAAAPGQAQAIQHEEARRAFTCCGDKAVLRYNMLSQQVAGKTGVELQDVQVDESLRSQGHGTRLILAFLEWAKGKGYAVALSTAVQPYFRSTVAKSDAFARSGWRFDEQANTLVC